MSRPLQTHRPHRRLLAAAFAFGAALAVVAGLAPASDAATQISLTGPESRGPIVPDASGRFAFPTVGLKRNSVNKFTVNATDDAGNTFSKDISITQLSLESIVVSRVTATALPPERVIQLVNDGVIKLDDPSNFNVSVFALVLTIGQEQVPIEVPIAMPKEELMGFENYRLPRDTGSDGGSKPNPPDTEIIVFDQIVPCGSCAEPPRIPGVIVIEGAIKSLKEFFSVRLLLMNVSGLFTLSGVKASLEFPDGGLSSTLPSDGVVAFDDIAPGDGAAPGQKEREFIIRGDEIGKRRVRVSFGGQVMGPGISEEEPVPFNGAAEAQVEVKGPPQFLVRLSHPANVVERVPYELGVEITNKGDAAALYASLELDVGADAKFADCMPGATPADEPTCQDVEGPLVRNLRHLFPGDVVTEKFTIIPGVSGKITSCVGASDQNVTLEVLVGTIGCLTGKFPPPLIAANGAPTVTVLPFANAQGIGIDSPVTAFFSEKVQESSITTGAGGSFQVFDPAGRIAPGRLRFAELREKTVAIWQLEGGITNRLAGNSKYTVVLTNAIRDLEGNALFNAWESTFSTTSPNEDWNPPTLTLSIEPGVDPAHVIPGQIVRVNAYAADQGTGVARVELRSQDADLAGSSFVLVDQKSVFDQALQGPCIFALDSARLLPGHTYQLRATAFDAAGNFQDATIPILLATSSAPPSITLPDDPSQPVLNGISVALTPSVVSPGVRSVRFFLDGAATPFATLTLAPFQATLGTLGLALGTHAVTAVAADGLGQTGQDEFVFELADNPSEPVVRFAGAADGASFVQGVKFGIAASAEDPVGLKSLRVTLDDPNGASLGTTLGSLQIDTAALAEGLHRLYAIATNAVGVSNDPANPDSYLEFMVRTPPNGPPPPAPLLAGVTTPVNGRSSIGGTTGIPFAEVDVTNLASGFTLRVTADAAGAFTATLDVAAGERLRVVVFDYATSQQASGPAEATVPAAPTLVGIQVAPSALAFAELQTSRALSVTALYGDESNANVTTQATYGSSASAVASVSAGGIVTAQGNGAASVSASFGGFAAAVPITVDAVILQRIEVSPASLAFVLLGQAQPLSVTGVFSDGSRQLLSSNLAFVSSVPAVASVTATGIVTANANGSAQITAQRTGVAPVSVSVTVDTDQDPAPSVQILGPAPGTDVERGQRVQVVVRADDAVGGVVRLSLTASGETTFSETRQVAPPAGSAQQTFVFVVDAAAALGGSITLSVEAEDTGAKRSAPASITLDVVDATAPAVSIQSPAPLATFNYGTPIPLTIAASDGVGVTQIRYETAGAATLSESQAFAPAEMLTAASFSLLVPSGPPGTEFVIRAFARDAAGNEGRATDVRVQLTGADITPPETQIASVGTPSGATVVLSYAVLAGASDLDHVELFFRRNGIGSFNRYTGSLGTGNGHFTPQTGATGTIAFDATRMGGDGSYEFFSVGVDRAGNREAPPRSGSVIVGDPGVAVSFATGAEVVTLTTDAEISGAAFEGRNLRVVGAALTLVGPHSFGNVELLSGAVLTHRDTTQSEAYGLELTAWTLSVDATSRIDVTARGFLGGDRSGLPAGQAHTVGFAAGSQTGTGGSYGGLGGKYGASGSSQPNPVYGSLTNPVDLGSGGGAWAGDGGDGGGRMLVGAINIAMDGAIRADGGLSGGTASSEGSGGSINLKTRTLSGAGALAANGGTTGGGNHVGGGGGRIALRYLDLSTYDASRVTSRGGDGWYGDGADGTIYLEAEGQTTGELLINGAAPGSPFTDLILPPGQTFSSVTLQNGARVIAQGAISISETLHLRGGSVLTHPLASEAGLAITARRIIVEAGSAIDVTGRGYRGGDNAGLGETAHTLGFTPGSGRGSGGSHGGTGGDYDASDTGVPGAVYGDPKRPAALGAGGGTWGGAGGDGGGRIRIVARDALLVDGAVRADGGLSSGTASGEGAGGSIWIETSRLGGTGTISASGGTTAGGNHTGGGGGRVALYADFVDSNVGLGGLRNVQAFGGDGWYGDGAAGTVFVKLAGQTDGTLYVDAGMTSGATWPIPTVLPAIGPGIAAAITADTLTVAGALRAFVPGGMLGLRLNPDVMQSESFEITANTGGTLQVATPNENGVAFESVAAAGRRYAGCWSFDQVVFRRGGHLELADPMIVAGALAIAEGSLLTHVETTASYEGALDLTLATLTVDASSRIDVSGRGYLGGDRAGLGGTAQTLGFASGAQPGMGGSYGGLGGKYSGAGGSQTNPFYGSLTEPLDLGSGGGAWSGGGGDGGGRIRIVADAMILDGALRADGGISSGSASGEGSGGSINLRLGTLSGGGSISASGGTTSGGNHTGGGGGRVAIRYTGSLTLPLTSVRATGGDGWYGDGGHGTVYVKAASQAYGDLVIDGYGLLQPPDSTVLPGDLRFDNLTLGSGVRALADAGVDVLGTLRLSGGARLSHSIENEFGLRLTARRIVIEAESAIDVTGRGYLGGDRSGLGGTAHTLGFAPGSGPGAGGSHGGMGGDFAGNGDILPGAVYGDPRRPAALGGGGGAWSGAGGDGGGLVRISASESLLLDGAVRADGGISSGSASGEGAGGSVWIETPLLSGTGTISANGGTTGGGNHTGGGGGRVVVYAAALDPAADFGALRRITAFGGDGWYGDGAAGTVFVKLAGQADGTLLLDSGASADATWSTATTLPPIGPGITAGTSSNTLTASGTLRAFVPGGLRGLRINPDATQGESFEIVANTETVLTVATPNENGVAFASVAGVGRRYAAVWRFDQVIFRRGAFLELADPLRVNGTLSVAEAGLLTHARTTTAYEGGLDLEVGVLTLDATSRIDVSARGYLGGDRAGLGGTAHTLGFAAGAQPGTGGSYGGLGGNYAGSGGQTNPVYGSATEPQDLGSGGGAWSGPGGDGGGRIRIVAGAMLADGSIRADGGLSGGSASGEGSGGSINLQIGTFAGAGSLSASSGTTGGSNHTGGGGGRISVRHTGVSTFPPGNARAEGGDGNWGDGQPGSILFQGP